MQTHINTDKQNTSLNSASTISDQLGIAPAELQQTLKLAGLLQTSLEIETVLNYFLDASHERVEFDGAQFDYAPMSIHLQFGQKKRHTCSYRLKLAGEFIGELVFSRRHRFAEEEMEILENMLCQLIYPLRNAVWYQRAVHSAQMDPLTGIQNRTAMATTLQREVDLAHRNHTPLSLIVVDIDLFKNINDQYGHSIGDAVLKEFSRVISDNLRSSDIVFRYGGEEFVILLTGTPSDDVVLVADRIRESVQNHPFHFEDLELSLTASFGTASLESGDTSDDLFEKADTALYKAKESGRNLVIPYRKEIIMKAANNSK